MLKTILQKMVDHDFYNLADLARQLGISEDLLGRMLEDLAQKGYLTPLGASDGENRQSCGGCSAHKSCSACSIGRQPSFTGWTLTAKGRAAAQRQP